MNATRDFWKSFSFVLCCQLNFELVPNDYDKLMCIHIIRYRYSIISQYGQNINTRYHRNEKKQHKRAKKTQRLTERQIDWI